MNIVFDLDGTLTHSAPDLQVAANRMLEAEGYEPLDLATITSFIGNGLPKLVERAMLARGLPDDQFDRLYAMVAGFYDEAPADLTKPFPGLIEALDGFKAAGHKMGVCTNKPEAPARAILAALDMEKYFDVVIGGDALPEKKPHPAPLFAAFDALGPGPRLYVGDSEMDAEAAERAGITFAIFTEGYRKTPLEQINHAFRFAHFAELPTIVETYALQVPAE